MKFTLNHSDENYPDLLIVPVAKQMETNPCLATIGKMTDIPIEAIQADFSADHKESHTLYFEKSKRIVLLGLGEKPGFQEVLKAFRSFSYNRKSPPSQINGHQFRF